MRLSVGSVSVTGAAARGTAARKRVVTMVTLAAREDTKPYVPYLNGDLRRSAELESHPEAGKLVYGSTSVPYARAQYYGHPHKTTPGTTCEWFAYGKAANLSKWLRIAQQEARVNG